MADTKISALTALLGVDVDKLADLLPIVDTSVTTTKKIIIQELVNAISSSLFETGEVKLTLRPVAPATWIMCDDGTIGNAISGATTRAHSDTEDLFTLLWDNVADAQAPVSGGRGLSAAADFGNAKTIALTKMLGRAFAVAGSGAGLSSRVLGLATGGETHALTIAELATHTHTQNAHAHSYKSGLNTNGSGVLGGTATANSSFTTTANFGIITSDTATNQNTGSGAAHTNMQPSAFVNVIIKL